MLHDLNSVISLYLFAREFAKRPSIFDNIIIISRLGYLNSRELVSARTEALSFPFLDFSPARRVLVLSLPLSLPFSFLFSLVNTWWAESEKTTMVRTLYIYLAQEGTVWGIDIFLFFFFYNESSHRHVAEKFHVFLVPGPRNLRLRSPTTSPRNSIE